MTMALWLSHSSNEVQLYYYAQWYWN